MSTKITIVLKLTALKEMTQTHKRITRYMLKECKQIMCMQFLIYFCALLLAEHTVK